jgi:PadR family transcriptional regulator, regulatory protein PadR
MAESSEILQGTLDMLVLRTLELGPMHGLGVSDRIRQITRGVFFVKPGSLFPALYRLEQNGCIKGHPGDFRKRLRDTLKSMKLWPWDFANPALSPT